MRREYPLLAYTSCSYSLCMQGGHGGVRGVLDGTHPVMCKGRGAWWCDVHVRGLHTHCMGRLWDAESGGGSVQCQLAGQALRCL